MRDSQGVGNLPLKVSSQQARTAREIASLVNVKQHIAALQHHERLQLNNRHGTVNLVENLLLRSLQYARGFCDVLKVEIEI